MWVVVVCPVDKCVRNRWRAGDVRRGPRVCELRREQHATVATRRHGPLPVQRVRPLPQDQRSQPTARQAEQTAGEHFSHTIVTRSL